jgi:hypothetical protein
VDSIANYSKNKEKIMEIRSVKTLSLIVIAIVVIAFLVVYKDQPIAMATPQGQKQFSMTATFYNPDGSGPPIYRMEDTEFNVLCYYISTGSISCLRKY